MGYYTNYTLNVYPKEARAAVFSALGKLPYFEGEEDIEEAISEECKWYDWEEDCKAVSAQLPTYLISLSGSGGSAGDVWRADFMGGEKVDFWKLDPTYTEPDAALVKKAKEASEAISELNQLNLYVASHVMGFDNKAYTDFDIKAVSENTLVLALQAAGFLEMADDATGEYWWLYSKARQLRVFIEVEPARDGAVARMQPTVKAVQKVIRAIAVSQLIYNFIEGK